tara:strand:+ start:709 stop:927 length:219 start_codon:yes stop_codon:yes gene_type:complete
VALLAPEVQFTTYAELSNALVKLKVLSPLPLSVLLETLKLEFVLLAEESFCWFTKTFAALCFVNVATPPLVL